MTRQVQWHWYVILGVVDNAIHFSCCTIYTGWKIFPSSFISELMIITVTMKNTLISLKIMVSFLLAYSEAQQPSKYFMSLLKSIYQFEIRIIVIIISAILYVVQILIGRFVMVGVVYFRVGSRSYIEIYIYILPELFFIAHLTDSFWTSSWSKMWVESIHAHKAWQRTTLMSRIMIQSIIV